MTLEHCKKRLRIGSCSANNKPADLFFFHIWNGLIFLQVPIYNLQKVVCRFLISSIYTKFNSKGSSLWIANFWIVAQILCCYKKSLRTVIIFKIVSFTIVLLYENWKSKYLFSFLTSYNLYTPFTPIPVS